MHKSLSFLLFGSFALTVACSSDPAGLPGPDGSGGSGDPGSGGAGPGAGGDAPGAGGDQTAGGGESGGGPNNGIGGGASGGDGSGGVPPIGGGGGGGTSAGGSPSGGAPGGTGGGGTTIPGGRFSCPPGSENLTPTLGTATLVPGTMPEMPGNSNSIVEGPVWREGKLYFSQMRDYGPLNPSRLMVYDGTTFSELIPIVVDPENPQMALSHAGTNGLALGGDGKLYGASHLVGGIVSFDLSANPPASTTVIAQFERNRLNSPNDLAIRSDGTIYFSDPDWQCMGGECPQTKNRVYSYSGGTLKEIPTDHMKPNGVSLSPDEAWLYVTGDGTMVRYPVMGDSVGTPEPFGNITGGDGMAIDCAGNIYVAANGFLQVLSKEGTPLGSITALGQATNAAFGGPDSKTLYITVMQPAGIYRVDVGVPGFPY